MILIKAPLPGLWPTRANDGRYPTTPHRRQHNHLSASAPRHARASLREGGGMVNDFRAPLPSRVNARLSLIER